MIFVKVTGFEAITLKLGALDVIGYSSIVGDAIGGDLHDHGFAPRINPAFIFSSPVSLLATNESSHLCRILLSFSKL